MQQPSVLVGLIGAGIQASRTPAMHEREGTEHGLRYLYKLIDLDLLGLDATALPDLLTAAERMGFAGLNVTHPDRARWRFSTETALDTLLGEAEVELVSIRRRHETRWRSLEPNLCAINSVRLRGGPRSAPASLLSPASNADNIMLDAVPPTLQGLTRR
jgi:hypothetical protein